MYRVAIVCEGPTDRAILEAILDNYFDDYESLAIQPPTTLGGGNAGSFGGGWKGVRNWSESEVRARGGLNNVSILQNSDLIIIQVDADVATEAEIGLEQPCPPSSGNSNQVRNLVLQWLGVTGLPEHVIACVPSMATETWALVSLFPTSITNLALIECGRNVKHEIKRLSKKIKPKLVVSQGGRLKNQASGYQSQSINLRITTGWTHAMAHCRQALRFDNELRAAIP